MADQQIPDLEFDPSGSDIARNDLVVIHRNNVDYKARLAGALLLPALPTGSDAAGKVLQINSAGSAPTWAVSEGQRWQLIGQPKTRPPGNTGALSPLVTSGLEAYRDFYLNITDSAGVIRGIELRYGTFVSYSADGSVRAWFSNNYTHVNFDINGSSSTIRQLNLYAR